MKRPWLMATAVVLAVVVVLDAAAVATGGFPSKVVRGTSVSAGASEPATAWWFAAGASQGGAVMDLHLYNPGSVGAEVTIRYFPGGGHVGERKITIAAASSVTVATTADRAGGFGGGYPGISVEVRSDRPVVAERTLAWNAPDAGRTGVWTRPGITELARSTAHPAGTWHVALFNPGDRAVSVHAAGRTIALGPRDRVDADVGPMAGTIDADLPVAIEAFPGAEAAGVPGTRHAFALGAAVDEAIELHITNPGSSPVDVELFLAPRTTLGNRPPAPPPAPEPTSIAGGETRVITMPRVSGAASVRAGAPVIAVRVERAEKAFPRDYRDPGFR